MAKNTKKVRSKSIKTGNLDNKLRNFSHRPHKKSHRISKKTK